MEMNEYAKLVAFVFVMSVLFTVGFANLFSDLPGARKSNALFIRKTDSYPLSAEVVNLSDKFKLGVSMDPGKIDFGRVSETGQVRKRIVLMNPSPYPSRAKFYVFGNISNYIHIGNWNGGWTDKWSVTIPPNSTMSVEIGFEGKERGKYEGELYIVTLMPRFSMGKLIEVI